MTTTTNTQKPAVKPAATKPAVAKTVAVAAPVATVEVAKKAKPEAPKRYRLITGIDDSTFCSRISDALDSGYVLYGSPAITFNGVNNIVAQAIVLKKLPKKGKNKKK
jgi:hypothetical protein